MGAKKAPKPPDTSKYSDQAFNISNMVLDWGKSIYEEGQQEWNQIRQWGQGFMEAVLPASEELFDFARQARDNYEQMQLPAIKSLFQEADTYASKAEEQRQRASAIQDVGSAMEAKREAEMRRLRSYTGQDPSEMRDQAIDRQTDIQVGAAQALAANQAGERTKDKGRALRSEAINVGNQFAQQFGAGMGQGAGLYGQGVSTYGNLAAQGMGLRGQALPYMGAAYQGTDLAAGIVDTSYGRELQRTELNNAAQAQNFSQAMQVGQSMAMIADGGEVMAPGGPTDDAGAIRISDGEYVIPADVVKKLGTNHFDKLIEKETGRPSPSPKSALPLPGAGGAPVQKVPDDMMVQPLPRAGVIR